MMVGLDRTSRWRSTAVTWVRKTTALLAAQGRAASSTTERWLVGYEASQLLEAVLSEAETLAGLLVEEHHAEDAERRARDLAALLRRSRLAGKLSNVEGRTPEEASAFLEKAEALRR